jgi:hypothetical protein
LEWIEVAITALKMHAEVCFHMERNSRYSSFDHMHNPALLSFSRSVTFQRENGDSVAESVLCAAVCEARISFFLLSGPSGDNFRVIPHLPTALGFGISSFRQRGVFSKGKVCQKKEWNK